MNTSSAMKWVMSWVASSGVVKQCWFSNQSSIGQSSSEGYCDVAWEKLVWVSWYGHIQCRHHRGRDDMKKKSKILVLLQHCLCCSRVCSATFRPRASAGGAGHRRGLRDSRVRRSTHTARPVARKVRLNFTATMANAVSYVRSHLRISRLSRPHPPPAHNPHTALHLL